MIGPVAREVDMMALARELFPIPRSRTGDGVRKTLEVLGELLPLDVVEVSTGTELYDWVAPEEWNLHEAWIADASGRRIVDAADSSLHVVAYSPAVNAQLTGADLDRHLHSIPAHPDRVPYRTAYHDHEWGFCVADRVRSAIAADGLYDVVIDATLGPGSLTYAECALPGRSEDSILLSTYVCHPALANDNVSGIVVLAALASRLAAQELRHTIRVVFWPATLGPLAWLRRHEGELGEIRAGLTINCVGDAGPMRYKRSRGGGARIDRVAERILRDEPGSVVEDFVPWGGDERQLCAPGFGLPVGTLTRTPHGRFPEYHSSADDLDLIDAEHLADSLRVASTIVETFDGERPLVGTSQRGEPQLGSRGLYGADAGGQPDDRTRAVLWALALADGDHSAADVAGRSGLSVAVVDEAIAALTSSGLLEKPD